MVTTRTPTQTWVAKNGYLYMGNVSGIAFSTAVSLSGAFGISGIAVESAVKNITITPPETSWEKQDFCGAQSGFQNQLLDEKPVGIATITATMILGEDELISDLMISGVGVVANTFTRYQIGADASFGDGSEATYSAVVTLVTSDGIANRVSFAVDNAKFTKWGDVRISGPDSHWEQDFTLICLPKDFYWEFKD